MFVKGKVVPRNIPEIEIADLKNITDIGADVRSRGNGTSEKDDEDEQRDFAAGKQRAVVAGVSEPIVIDELQ